MWTTAIDDPQLRIMLSWAGLGCGWATCGMLLGTGATGAAAVAVGLAFAAWGAGPGRQKPRPVASPSGATDAPLQLAALLATATVLRAYELDSALWYDEIVTLVEYVRLTPAELATTYTSTNNHILYSLLANATVAGFGESAWAIRLPAAAFGVASLVALWWMAHELAPRREARLATWAVALSYHHVWFSQNARGYTGLLLAGWLGTALYLRARRGGPRTLWIAYAFTLALGAYIHLTSLFVFAAHAITYLAQEARLRHTGGHRFDAAPLFGFALGALLTLQLYAALLPDVVATLGAQSAAASGGAAVASWKSPLWTVVEIVRSLPFGPASLAAALAAFAIGTTGLVSLARARPFDALLLVLPSAIALAVLLAVHFNIWPRYFLVALGFGAILGVRGVFVCVAAAAGRFPGNRWLDPPERAATALCALAIAASALSVGQSYRYPKQDYPGALEWVAAHLSRDEVVATTGLASLAYGRYYEPSWPAVDTVAQLERLQAQHDGVWLVYSFPIHLRATRPELFERIERDFEPVARFPGTLGDGDVHVLQLRAHAQRAAPL